MANVSFVVRSTTGASGSYLRYPDGSASPGLFPARPDYDSALRASGVIVPAAASGPSTFSAIPITYGTVELDWTTTVNVASLTPSITSLLLVYSPVGIPQTVLSGTVLLDSSSTFTYLHDGLPQGQWAYYGLFGHYTTSNSSADYYQKVAEIEVLVPTDYGSTLRLWQSVPAFARASDSAMGDYGFSTDIGLTTLNALGYTYDANGNVVTLGDPIGPLLKFLSIVGFDIDGIRTTIDYIMVSRDPEIANSDTLDDLANMLGVDINVVNLGDNRLRSVLDNIGTYRRSKGTLSALQLYVSAITGSNIVLNSTTRKLTIYSQRANYITAPRDGVGIVTYRVSDTSEVLTPQAFSYAGYNAHAGDISHPSSTTWALNTSANGITGVMVHLSSPIPVVLNDFVSFSISSTTPLNLQWARLVDASGNILGFSQSVVVVNGINTVEINVAAAPANLATFTTGFIEFRADLVSRPFVGTSYLAEVNYLGAYFDGGSTRGGWLVDTNGSTLPDFRWLGSVNSSISVYSEDFGRTVGVVKDAFIECLPIQVESAYTITVFNGVRGIT